MFAGYFTNCTAVSTLLSPPPTLSLNCTVVPTLWSSPPTLSWSVSFISSSLNPAAAEKEKIRYYLARLRILGIIRKVSKPRRMVG